jgi:hypothetical protein
MPASQTTSVGAIFPRDHGLRHLVTSRDNAAMKANQRHFKGTQVFGWESEPANERPSEFVQSTGYSALSGYYGMPDARATASRPPKRSGLGFLLFMCTAIVSFGTVGLYWLMQVLRA